MNPRGDLQLAFGYWIVSHKQQLKTWWAILLLSVIGITLIWTIIFFSVFFAQQGPLDQRLAASASAVAGLHPPASLAPTAPTVSSTTIITRDTNHVDLVATITNPNSVWGASEVRYHFHLGDRDLDNQTAWLNPDAQRALIQLNVASPAATSAALILDDVVWVRQGTAAIPTPNFSLDQITLSPTTVTISGHPVLTMTLKATLTNKTVYNFLHVRVPIVLTAGNAIVAVDDQSIDRWASLTAKTVTSTWSYPISGADHATIEPQVSQFDSANLFR